MGIFNFLTCYRKRGVKARLLLGYITVAGAFLLLGELFLYPVIRETVETEIENNLDNSTRNILNTVKAGIDVSVKNYLRAVAETNRDIAAASYKLYKQGKLSEAEAKRRTVDILLAQQVGRTGYLYVIDSRGIGQAHPFHEMNGRDWTSFPFIREEMKRKEGYLEYQWKNPGETTEKPKGLYMVYFAPWDWIIGASAYREDFRSLVNIDDFKETLKDIHFGKTGYSYITDSKGNVVFHPFLSGNKLEARSRDGQQFLKQMLERKNGRTTYAWRNLPDQAFRNKLAVFNYLPEADWLVVSACYEDEIYEPLRRIRAVFLSVLGITLAVLALLTVKFSSYIVRGMDKLIAGFRAGSAGDFSTRLEKTSEDEFGKLTDDFNDFMAKLEDYNRSLRQEMTRREKIERDLRATNERQDSIMRASSEFAIIAINTAGVVDVFNAGAELLLGYRADEVISKMTPAAWHDSMEMETRAKELEKAGRAGTYIFAPLQGDTETREWTFIRKDGSRFPVLLSVAVRRDNRGELSGLCGIGFDITERKRNEATIRALNETLESRLVALTKPVGDISGLQLSDLFNIEELQRIQDSFSAATGIAAIITDPQGNPLTRPSNFCALCGLVRGTEKGLRNCYHSDALLGQPHPEGPVIQRCMSGGLLDAGTCIRVGDKHIANWLIGQVLEEPVDEAAMLAYARDIGVEEDKFRAALAQAPRMPRARFEKIAAALYLITSNLSKLAIQNVQQARFITERKQAENALLESTQQMREIFSFLPDATFAIDKRGMVVAWNRAIEEMTGIKAEQMLGKGNHEYSLPFYGVRRPLLADLTLSSDGEYEKNYSFVRREGPVLMAEASVTFAQGEPRTLWVKAVPLYGSSGDIVGAIETIRDITDNRKAREEINRMNRELEERVRQRTAQLEASMKELDSFSYSVSHDLKTPLRAIDGFARIILEEHAAQLNEEGKRLFERISESAKKMGDLIDDLLSLSRLDRKKITFAEVDMNKLLADCLEEVRPSCAGRTVEFLTADLPSATGDAALLREVLVNLLANAVKFTRQRAKALIETGFREENGEVIYFVRDNGAGFDMAYAGNIFKEFIRLHHESEFEGTGIGLSIVQRILTRHGGRVWTEAAPDKGATFYFTLGKEEKRLHGGSV